MNREQRTDVEVTDTDLDLLKKARVHPHYKVEYVDTQDSLLLQNRNIRVSVLQTLTGRPVEVIAPEDATLVHPALKEKMLKRDPANALQGLSFALRQFDSANKNIPDFESLPDHELYARRLEAILDVINSDPKMQEFFENFVPKGISKSWLVALQRVIAKKKFDKDSLHQISKLVDIFSRFSEIELPFERAYTKRTLAKRAESN